MTVDGCRLDHDQLLNQRDAKLFNCVHAIRTASEQAEGGRGGLRAGACFSGCFEVGGGVSAYGWGHDY